jgi:predicted RND superfamily exporter protein
MSPDLAPGGSPNGGGDYIEGLNRLFERIAGWSYDHRWIVLSICVAALAGCAYLASGVRTDNSFEAFFDRDDPVYDAYLQYRDDFGSDEVSYIVYEAPDHPHGPWNLEVMRKIEHLTEVLEEEVHFVKEVTSLVNVEFVEPISDGIEIYDLLEEFPETQEALLEIKRQVLQKPLYVGSLVSRDGDYAAIAIEMDRSSIDPVEEIRLDPEGGDGLENLYPQVTYREIEEILARPEYSGIEFHHTGDIPLNAVLNIIVAEEGALLGGICAGVIGAVLLLFFRRFIGVAGPLAVAACSILVSVALIGLLGWNLDILFGMLPTLLIAVGVADGVHIISEFRAYHADLGDRREAVRRTLRLVGTPCLLTSLTTAAGFGAMSIAPIKMISHFAIYSAVGVLAAFLLSVTLLVVFLSFGSRTPKREITEREKLRAKGGRWFVAGLDAVARFDIRHRRAIIAVGALVLLVSGVGIGRLEVDSNFLTDFSERVPIRETTFFVDEVMSGTNSFVYLFDAGVADGIKQPEVLREIERLQHEADEQVDVVTRTNSIVDVLKDINQSFHGGDPAYYALPESRELVAQYLLLYEISGGEELEEYVSTDYSRAALDLRCKWTNSSLLMGMTAELDAYLEAHPLEASAVAGSGIGALWLKLSEYITQSQIRGFLLAFVAIAAMMCLLFRSLRTGLLSMVPGVAPVIVALGAMGWLNQPLDYTKLLIAPVAIGIAVDYAIHLVTRYRHEFLRCRDYERALYASMRDVGRALVVTSVVLVLGFLVFLASSLASQAVFGVLLASTILLALIADFLLMPALVMMLKPFGPEAPDAAHGVAGE